MTESEQPAGNWLERRLASLEALYQRFGRDGFKDQPLADIHLLLAAKELQFRDTPKGRDLNEQQKATNRMLELEIGDIKAFVRGQVASMSMADLRHYRPQQEQHQGFKPRHKDHGLER